MIITSYHPVYTFTSSREDKYVYHKFAPRKTLEMNILWYLYIRHFCGKDCDILIIDQNSDYSIDEFLKHVEEPYDISPADDYNYDKNVKLHIKQFKTKERILRGVKRLYHYMYRFCYYNNEDFFFIENDCLVARNLFEECKNYDFATNTIDQKHRVCDTYINFIKNYRLKEHDDLMPLDKFLDLIRDKYDVSKEEVWGHGDVSSMILNERGTYMKYCYGDILAFNWDRVFHNDSTKDLIQFLKENPIDHPHYKFFIENCPI